MIVYDNADDQQLLAEYWPRTTTGAILVTSRHPESVNSLTKAGKEVTTLTQTDGSAFLISMLHNGELHNGNQHLHSSVTMQLSKLLDGLPLALWSASGFIRQSGCSLPEALDLFKSPPDLFDALEGGSDAQKRREKEYSLRTVWELNMSSLSETAAELLGIISFLDPDGVPESLFKYPGSSLRSMGLQTFPDYKAYFKSVISLKAYSLVHSTQSRGRQEICIHRLVQEAALTRMRPEHWQRMFRSAVELLWAVFPKQCEEGQLMSPFWQECLIYAAHVESLESRYCQSEFMLQENLHFGELLYHCSW